MKIKDILQRDPAANPLINQGQARITDRQNERAMQELHGELSTFVCEGQYADGVQKIIRSFIDNLGRTNQRGPGSAASSVAASRTFSKCSVTYGKIPSFRMVRRRDL